MKMKKIYNIISVLTAASLLSACVTSEKFTVTGAPGSKIYSPYKKEIATIQSNGKAKIELPSNSYYAYLYTYNNVDDVWVPFVLETKKNSHNGTKALFNTSIVGAGIGLPAFLAGTIACLAGGEESSEEPVVLGLLAGGGALSLISSFSGLVSSERISQLSYQYNFSYKKNQVTNSDLSFTPYVPPFSSYVSATSNSSSYSSSTTSESSTSSVAKRSKATSSSSTTSSSKSSSTSESSSVASRSRKDPAQAIVGTYTGTGTLLLNNKTTEKIPDLVINITFVDKGKVKVEILEEGEPFFASDEIYDVTIDKSGNYSLTHTKIPSAKITISSKKVLNYTHPNVNIDGDKYTFNITATFKK